MTDPKIEPSKTLSIDGCPYCRSECIVQEELFPPIVECTGCQYYAHSEETPTEAIAAHNQLCEYVRFGKAAKTLCKNPPRGIPTLCGSGAMDERRLGFDQAVKVILDRLQEKGGE